MSRNFALTSNGPLSGKSTLAKHLEQEYGFIRADHSRSLVSSFVVWANHLPNPEQSGLVLPITVEQVYQNKELYRGDLQEHGYRIGFNDPLLAQEWVVYTIARTGVSVSGGKPHITQDIVFDSFRGEEQAEVLRNLGFELVQIEISEKARMYRALKSKSDFIEMWVAMEDHPELELGIQRPDIRLNGELPVEVLGRSLMHRTEEARGVQIFGNQV